MYMQSAIVMTDRLTTGSQSRLGHTNSHAVVWRPSQLHSPFLDDFEPGSGEEYVRLTHPS